MTRILVVLPNWFGETLFATPFLRALRAQQPEAFIATLGWPQCRHVLLHNPHVNELLDYDERGAHRSVAGKWRLIQRLRVGQFDAALILRPSLSRSLLLAASGIPVRIGFANAKSGWALTRRMPAPSRSQHKAAGYLPLLAAAGGVPILPPPEYVISDEERRVAHELLHEAGADGRLIVLHPGANWFHKRWPTERFAELADRLAAAGVRFVVSGGPDDVPLADSIAQRMRTPATILAGRTSIRQLGAILERADLIIAADTGITHIAAALRRPLVALYGPTSPAFTGPLGDPARTIVLHHPDCCPRVPCFRPEHPGYPGMRSLTVDEVHRAAVRLLEPR